MNAAQVFQSGVVGAAPVAVWSIVGQRDFNGDAKADFLWRDTSGDVAIWFMNGTQVAESAGGGNVPTVWSVVGTGDFNGDGMGDILWQNTRRRCHLADERRTGHAGCGGRKCTA